MAKRRAFMLSASQYMQQVRLPPEFLEKSRSLADNLLKDAVYRHHTLRHELTGRVDNKQWKLIKDKHQVSCYRSQAQSKSPTAPTAVPEVMAIGLVPGSLEDVLHGVVNFTPEAMHIESALARSDLTDSRILAILNPPTPDDPFDALTVKWVLRSHPGMSKQRDYVYLEYTGMTTSPDGETLGFLIAHSVTMSAVPEFHKDSHISRGQLSYCYLFRQRKQHGVDVFFKGAINPLGGAKDRTAVSLTVDMVISACPTAVQLAMMKKLMFCLRTLPVPSVVRRSRGSSNSSSSSGSSNVTGRSRSLGSNGSFLRRLTLLGRGNDTTPRASVLSRTHSHSFDTADLHASSCEKCNRHFNALKTKAKCQLCFKTVCSRCRVLKRVIAFEDNMMYPEKLDFCTDCVANTSNTSSTWIAAQDLHELDHMLNENQADLDRANTESTIRKPLWEMTPFDERQTISSEFSTRSSTSSRYLVTLTNTCIVEDLRHSFSDGQGVQEVDEDLSQRSGLGESFVVHDDDEDDEMPIVDSFVDDEFLLDASDEIFLSVQEEDEELYVD